MKPFTHRRQVLWVGLALAASVVAPAVYACEFFSLNLRVTHPWTRASLPNATTAVVVMKIDQVTQTDRLIGVETPVAEGAELIGAGDNHDVSLVIPRGREVLLGETNVQLRLTNLKHPLEIARTYPMKLIFEKGGVLDAELNVDYMPAN